MTNESDIEFLQAFWSRRPVFTYLFFALNIFIFVLMEFAGGATNEAVLMAFGVKANALIDQGQYWRFVMPIFLHIGFLHIGFNSYALWIVGPQVEKLYGGARFVLLYLATGIAGVAGSYWYHPQAISAGASGAIFGLFGVLLVFGFRHRHNIPPFFRRAVGTGVLPVIVLNLIIGFSIPAIDNSAHIGGLLMGMALAAVIPFQRPGASTPAVFTAIQIALFAIVLGCFYEVATHYDGPRISFSSFSQVWGGMLGRPSGSEEFIDVINASEHAFGNAQRALAGGEKSDIESSIGETAKSIDRLKAVPSLNATSDRLTANLLGVMQEQYGLLQEARRAGGLGPMQQQRVREIGKNYGETLDSLTRWVNSEGERYGIQLRKQP